MGCLKPCLTTTTESGNREIVVFELYDEVEARNVSPTNPGFDDLLGEPYLEDDIVSPDSNEIGERVRPGTIVKLKARVEISKNEEQNQDGTGNDPQGSMRVIVDEPTLLAATPVLLANGVVKIRPNDRLLRIETPAGAVRAEFTKGQRFGKFVIEVRPGDTGEGDWTIVLEERSQAAL